VAAEFTRTLRPLLPRYETHPTLHLLLFTLDETMFSRELALLAYAGAIRRHDTVAVTITQDH